MTFFLTRWFYYLMQFLYRLFNDSYLLTILVSTLLLRLVQIYPDISNRKTQLKTAEIQPEINELQKRYEKDPQKLREEQNKLMKKHGINTLTSCLPMLLIFPLFFCFLNAFRCWGNEETITLMYETAVAQTMEEGSEERARAEQQAMDTFNGFRFLWVKNIWQPDNFISGNLLLFRMDGEVITPAKNISMLSSNALKNMPLLQKGYTDKSGKFVSGEEIWNTLVDVGLASGEYGDAGNTSGCNSCSSCSTDKTGMSLLPEKISPEIAKKMIGVETSKQVDDGGSQSTATGSDIYNALMKRYPDAISKNGKTPANGFLIMPFLAAGMQLVSTIISMRRTKKEGQQNEQAKQMNAMMYFFPVMSILICMSSTTAFAFYWTVSGAIQLISTLIINAVFDRKKKKEAAK